MAEHTLRKFFAFAKRGGRPLLLDGAVGSLLQEESGKDEHLWTSHFNTEAPQTVINLHKRYIAAGADIITTNTFRTNPAAIVRSGREMSADTLVAAAVECAKKAAEGHNVFIAGSNPPAEDSYQTERTLSKRELLENHSRHITLLVENGVDFILNETMGHFDEIEIISKYCSSYRIPYVISLYSTPERTLLSGEPIEAALDYAKSFSPAAVGVNCIQPDTAKEIVSSFRGEDQWGYYINCGSGSPQDEQIACDVTPEEFAKHFTGAQSLRPAYLGGCCGTTPAHIAALRRLIDEKN